MGSNPRIVGQLAFYKTNLLGQLGEWLSGS